VDLHWLEPPDRIGTLTVCEAVIACGPDEHAAIVEAWARDVWTAWESHHKTVRGWLDIASTRAS
jgi:hypothetical protein